MNDYEKLLYKSNRQKHQLKILQDKCHKYNFTINNLQFKIDKAIEYVETLEIDDYDGNSYFIQDKNKKELFIEDIGNNILDILKEDK